MSARRGAPRSIVARIGLPLGPLAFAVILAVPDHVLEPRQRAVAATTAWTAIYWITDAMPIGATSLLPAVLFPLLGVMGARDVAPFYMRDLVFLLMGAFIIALGIERWNLHKRFALTIIAVVGTKPRQLVLGFMIASALLSFWINNTSTTLLMLPIGLAVVRSLGGAPGARGFAPALLLGMAYSASLGGIATPVGTAPNQVFLGQFREVFPDGPEISFGAWMAAWTPLVLLYLPLGWLYLTRIAFRVPRAADQDRATIARARAELGRMGPGETRMALVFALTAVLWVTRADLDLGFRQLRGWVHWVAPAGVAHPASWITDATVAVGMALATFLIPVGRGQRLMDWETARRLPWEVLLLIGGGFAIAAGFKASGLDETLGQRLGPLLEGRPDWLIVLAVVVFVAALTEVTSNTATTAVLLPVLATTSVAAGVSPLLTMLPATVAASAAFMLPVATPPNAVVFSSGQVPAPTMARVGLGMNLIVALLISLVLLVWGREVFEISAGVPDWARSTR